MNAKTIFGMAAFALLLGMARSRISIYPGSYGDNDAISAKVVSARPVSEHVGITINTASANRALEDMVHAIEIRTDPDDRAEALDKALQRFSTKQVPAALSYLEPKEDPASKELSLVLFHRWAESDAADAALWIWHLPEGIWRRTLLEQVAVLWTNSDASSAGDWAQTIPNDSEREAAIRKIAYETARADGPSALNLASGLSATAERDELIVYAVSQWAAKDAQAASDWGSRIANERLRNHVLGSVAIALADQDGEAAARLVARAVSPGEDQDRAALSVVQRWAQSSIEASTAWVAQFPETPLREAAVENLIQVLAYHQHATPAEGNLQDLVPE
jgi:hypothetical protein